MKTKWYSIPVGVLALLLVGLNTAFLSSILFVAAFFKWLLPIKAVRNTLSRFLIVIAETWIAVNSYLIDLCTSTKFEITGLESLRYDGWYLVISNHQTWVDIPVLQKVFNRKIPFLKFFLKDILIWVPFLGLAWWALDFPFMKRYSKQQIEKNPKLKGKDVEATRKACERFRHMPVSVMNFVEGTRFNAHKHASQQSPFPDLLKVKAGGVAFVLDAMGEQIQTLLDVTLVYPGGKPSIMDLFFNRVPKVIVEIRERNIPAEMRGDYENDAVFRERFQKSLNQIWLEKQQAIDRLKKL
jgi:1-acyl-sn-glycerol-3-phosphate acyltransferase